MKTRAFVVEKKVNSLLFRRFKKAVSTSAFTASFLQNTSLIFIHSAQAAIAITHTAGTRAHRLFLSLCSRSRE